MNILLSLRRLVAAILSLVQFFALLFSGAYAPGSGEFAKGWSNDNNGYPNSGPEVERLTEIVPSARQLAYAELEYYTFIHYGMNTFTNSEWGTGKESPSQFNPQKVDTDQWVQAVKASGSKGLFHRQAPRWLLPLAEQAYKLHRGFKPLQEWKGRYCGGAFSLLCKIWAEIRHLPLPMGSAR